MVSTDDRPVKQQKLDGDNAFSRGKTLPICSLHLHHLRHTALQSSPPALLPPSLHSV